MMVLEPTSIMFCSINSQIHIKSFCITSNLCPSKFSSIKTAAIKITQQCQKSSKHCNIGKDSDPNKHVFIKLQ